MSREPLTTKQAAKHCGISESYLRQLRQSEQGPPYYKLAYNCVHYYAEDLDRWIERFRHEPEMCGHNHD